MRGVLALANVNAGKSRKQKVVSKLCVKCGKVQPLSEFYGNKDWAAQSYHDVWCKSCAAICCVSKDGAREYCWYNNRLWSDSFWEMAMKKAMYALSNDDEYLRGREEKRRDMEDKMAGRYIFSIMNLTSVYRYSPNFDGEGTYKEFDSLSHVGVITSGDTGEPGREDDLVYSREWNGMYTQREIDYLDDYYARLEEGFVLDNQNIQDYARKAAKAS